MARCKRPFLKNGIPCPCGRCSACRSNRASGWGFRIALEAERLGSAFFITLTYDNEHVPRKYLKKSPGENFTWRKPYGSSGVKRKKCDPDLYKPTKRLTCDISHLQKFIKRLRRRNNAKFIKYYGVSEYGIDNYTAGINYITPNINASGNGTSIVVSMEATVVDYFSLQEFNILTLLGKTV